jgi:hypothetical protein
MNEKEVPFKPFMRHSMNLGLEDFFGSPVGRRCCAAPEFTAERQLCPTNKAEIFVLHPVNFAFQKSALFLRFFLH